MPALLISTSSRPNSVRAISTSRVLPSLVEMSEASATTDPPEAAIASAARRAGSASSPLPSIPTPRSLTTTCAPRDASNRACAKPIPRPAPVTIATRPSNRKFSIRSHLHVDPQRPYIWRRVHSTGCAPSSRVPTRGAGMTRNPHAGEPFTDDDEEIAAALGDVSIPALLCSLVHMTGDPGWVRGEVRPRVALSLDIQSGIPPDQRAQVR